MDETSLRDTSAPNHNLVRLAKKIGEERFSTKIQTENVFFGKTNSRGFWGKIEQSFRPEQFYPQTRHIAN